MRALEFIRDHVTFKLPYDFSYHMKTPHVTYLYQLALRIRRIEATLEKARGLVNCRRFDTPYFPIPFVL